MDLTKAGRPLSIWAVSDGRAGIEAQALALAEAVARARPAEITLKRVAWRGGLGRLPTSLMMALPRAAFSPTLPAPFTGRGDHPQDGGRGERGERPLHHPDGRSPSPASQGRKGSGDWPDLWIAAGRASLPLSVHMRRWSKGKTLIVQAQDPRWPASAFDLVIPPEHDGLTGDTVFPILGAPSRMTPQRLAEGRARFAAELSALPRPHVAVAIGGASAAYELPADQALVLALAIRQTVEAAGGSILLTFSRRTPGHAMAAMRTALEGAAAWIWDGEGDNPYAGFLGSADHVLVTEDSVNMALDAAATEAPLQILPLRPKSARAAAKFRAFHAALQARGRARPFGGGLERWPVAPILEADRAAAEILRRLDRKLALDPATLSREPAA